MSNRSERTKNIVRKRSKGICENCGKLIKIINKKGNPFIITHHIQPISEGGDDTEWNVAGICVSCHAIIHYDINGDTINEKLKHKIIAKQTKINENIHIKNEKRKRQHNATKINQELINQRHHIALEKQNKKITLENEMKKGMISRKNFKPF